MFEFHSYKENFSKVTKFAYSDLPYEPDFRGAKKLLGSSFLGHFETVAYTGFWFGGGMIRVPLKNFRLPSTGEKLKGTLWFF